MLKQPTIIKSKKGYDPEFRVAELEAVAAALREDLPGWQVSCVGGCGPSCFNIRRYEDGHRWIMVYTGVIQIDVSVNHGEISTRIGRFNSIVIPVAAPDSLERFSKRLKAGIVNYMEMVTVGN